MLSMPGVTPKWFKTIDSEDKMSDRIKNDLSHISEVTDVSLSELMKEAGKLADKLAEDPNSNPQDIQNIVKRINSMIEAAKNAREGVDSFVKGMEAERNMVRSSLNENSDSEIDKWCDEAREYFDRTEDSLSKTADKLQNEPTLLGLALKRLNYTGTDQENHRKFWGKVSNVIVGLELIIERTKSFPAKMADKLRDTVDSRVKAIEDTFEEWVNDVGEVMEVMAEEAVEMGREMGDFTYALAKTGYNAVDRAIDSVMEVGEEMNLKFGLMAQSTLNKATKGISGAYDKIVDGVKEISEPLTKDFHGIITERRSKRPSKDTSKKPDNNK